MMAKFKGYESYVDSGVESIGYMPTGWTLKRLKHVCVLNPSKSEAKLSEDTEVTFLPMENILSVGKIDTSLVKEYSEVAVGYTYFRDGDIIVAKVTPCFENGNIALAQDLTNGIAFGTTELHVIRPTPKCDRRYIFYLVQSNRFRLEGIASMYGVAGLKRIPADFMANFKFALPSVSEQIQIADFLDQKTNEIDSVVADKQKLISVLDEQRKTLITDAVTKGLNSDVETKDFGVEWIGDIPEHWQVFKIKHVLSQIEYGISESSKGEGEYKLLTMGNISHGEIEIPSGGSVNELDERYLLNTNDLLFNRTNSLDQIAKVGIFRGSVEDKVTFASYLVRLKVNEKADSEFLNLLLNCHPFLSYARSFAIPSVSQANLNANRYTNLKIILPPVDEQRVIRDRIVERSQHISDAIDEINQQIHKLKEYRMSLIFEAVTGKIDVRDVTVEATMMA